jgi:hypothetical protein
MKVKELIAELEKINPESRVFMGYDGNVVVTEPYLIEYIWYENQIGSYWYSMKEGDTVILCSE